MSTALPSSFTFESLSRLPANSFVLRWEEVRPDNEPGQIYDFSSNAKIKFHIRGNTNEFLLNTGIYINGTAGVQVNSSSSTVDLEDQIRDALDEGAGMQDAYHYFDSSRESMNSGALAFLDNQDSERSHQYNNARIASARRNRRGVGLSKLDDLEGCTGSRINSLIVDSQGVDDKVSQYTDLTGFTFVSELDRGVMPVIKNKSFAIPLGLYSNMVNSHSVIPLGLFSSTSVNGWSIELTTTKVTQPTDPATSNLNNVYFIGELPANRTIVQPWMSNLRLYVPIIKVYDPAVMDAVLSLYEKREMVKLGDVEFPLSLRLNSIAYRFYNETLGTRNNYNFRLSTTDRSVRGAMWYIYQKDSRRWALSQPIKVTRLHTKIGTEDVHPVVEDTNRLTNNVLGFVNVNAQKVAPMFSPLPYYQETRKFDGLQEQSLGNFNNVDSNNVYFNGTNDLLASRSLCYGYIDFQNMDHREADWSGSFQASGKDCTNAGAIDIAMNIQLATQTQNVQWVSAADIRNVQAVCGGGYTNIDLSNYEILFMTAYDIVTEISPSGVMDITNAVL
jgi:hypothetical protein